MLRLQHQLTEIKDAVDPIPVEHPANPSGNDPTSILTSSLASGEEMASWDLDRMGIMLLAVRLSARDAIIRPDKLRDYLLSTTHPDGRGKAEYLGRLGYSQDAFGRIDADLREQVLSREAQPGRASRYGQKL